LNRGSTDVTKQAHDLIAMLIKDPEVNIMSVIAKNPKVTSAWDKSVVIKFIITYLMKGLIIYLKKKKKKKIAL
jgi:hypothetical protein